MNTLNHHCDMKVDCPEPTTMLDDRGFIYCTAHGMARRSSGIPCRKLRPYELSRLVRGEPVARY